MKKVFSVLLSLFMLWGGVLISCSADSESNGGSAPEALKLIICSSQGDAKESTDLTYNKAKGEGGFFYVKSNYEDLSAYKITEISLVRTSDDDATDITSKVNIEEKSRFNGYKIDFSSAVSNAGNYKIIVYAQKGSEKEVNITLNLTVEAGSVDPEENPTPVITKQPESVQWKAGENAKTLTVEATISSGTISYQWHKDGNPIDGATSASYTPDKTNGKGSYYVVVLNASDKTKSVQSSKVSVTIVAEGEVLPPVITADLAESVSYNTVSDIKALSITATAEDGADIYYLWYKDGTAIGAPSTDASTYIPTVFGSYYCELRALKDGKDSQTITSKTITISESAITVNVSISPTSAYTDTELTASVDYNVESAKVTYQWVTTDSTSGGDTEIPGATTEKYTPQEAGRYSCKVTATSAINEKNTVTKTSTPVNVSVKQSDDPVMPVINNINGNNSDFALAVKEGGSFTLTVSASTTDSGKLTYEWFKQGNTTSLGTGTSYSKPNVTSSDAGKYYVRVTNTLNGKPVSTDSFKVTVTITSSEIGSGNGQFDFTSK
ncbi:MAG: immunoglobulin domain-containing protein [Treponema sp.]|nr:immunoglobulin domain-containing protein [Treponema sp.]